MFSPLRRPETGDADELLAKIAKMLGPTAEAGAQTGGVKEAGKAVTAPKLAKKMNTGTIVNRLRVSYTTLRAAKVDTALRGVLLAELLT